MAKKQTKTKSKKKNTISPFDYVKSITFQKNDMMNGTLNDDLAEKQYEPFLTNRALSKYYDTIEAAHEMNINSHIDKKLQYDYLLNTVRKRKRFSSWPKKKTSENLEYVSQYYQVSMQKADEYLEILTDEQLNEIKRILTHGIKQ